MTAPGPSHPVHIRSVWREYFEDHHEGLGTTYERFVLHRHFEKLRERFAVTSVLEAPAFGMTGVSGINSLWWAHRGIPVTLVDDDMERLELIREVWTRIGLGVDLVGVADFRRLPFRDLAFDLSWNFAALWFVPGLETFLAELCRTTRKVIFICIPNKWGIGHVMRFGGGSGKTAGLNLDGVNPESIIDAMKRLGWGHFGRGYFDVPPWPDIAMKKEDLLRKLGVRCRTPSGNPRLGGGMCILDYFNGSRPDMERDVLRYAFMENSPAIIQKFWAHHVFLQFVPTR